MSLNEVNYQKVLTDQESFPPDLEILVQTSDTSCSIQRQKFGCHRLLLSIASPYFCSRLRNPEDKWLLFNDTNPEAFKKVVDFIYHKRPFKIQNGGLGSSFIYIKLVLEVLCLAIKFQLPKLVQFCEKVVEEKITLTSANSQKVQDFLSSNEGVTQVARNGLLLKYKSVARRKLVRAGVPPEELKKQLEAEMQIFATAVNPDALSSDYFNSSFRSVAASTLNQTVRSTLNQTARSLYYRERSVARSVFHGEEEDAVEIVLDSSPPRMAVSNPPQIVFSPLQPPASPLAASSSHQAAPPVINLASQSFLGCPVPSEPDEGNLFDAYNNSNNNNSFMDTVSNNPEDDFAAPGQQPRFCSTPNPYLAAEPNAAPYDETPRYASTPNPYLEPEPNPEPTPVVNSSTPTFEELVVLIKNIKNLSRSNQDNLLAHIRKLERENPSLVTKIHQQLNSTDMQ